MSLKKECKRIKGEGYYLLTQGMKVPVRIFMNPQLFEECEEAVFQQVRAATEFPGVTDVVLTPDAHSGYVVPVGCVMATNGTLCQAPVGYDIGRELLPHSGARRPERGHLGLCDRERPVHQDCESDGAEDAG